MHVGVGELVVRDAGAEAVDQADAARRHDRMEQPAHLAVHLVRVRAPVDRVDDRAPVAEPSAGGFEVVRLDERHAQVLRDPAVLPVRGVVLAVGQHHDMAGTEHAPERVAEAVDRARERLRRQLERPQRRLPRRGPVAQPARRAHVVLQHQPLARGVAHDVEPRDPDPHAARRPDALHGGLEVVGRVEHPLGHDALGDDPPLAVHVGDERVQRPGALGEPGGQRLPFRGRDHARDRIDVPGVVAVDRREADPLRVDLLAHRGAEGAQIGGEDGVHDRAGRRAAPSRRARSRRRRCPSGSRPGRSRSGPTRLPGRAGAPH